MLNMNIMPEGLTKWHEFVVGHGEKTLEEGLATTITFHSPFVWRPIVGKAEAMRYLQSAVRVLENFTYHRQFVGDDSITLEFSANVGELSVKGVDILQFDSEGKIIDFEVMVRPNSGLQALAAKMAEALKHI